MTWYAVYDKATGALVSTGTSVASDGALAARGLAKKMLAFNPQVRTKRWRTDLLEFEDLVPPKDLLRARDFLDRFTVTEREDIFDAARNGSPPLQKRLNAFLEYVKTSGWVSLDSQYVVDSVTAMETAGLIGAGRAAEVLA